MPTLPPVVITMAGVPLSAQFGEMYNLSESLFLTPMDQSVTPDTAKSKNGLPAEAPPTANPRTAFELVFVLSVFSVQIATGPPTTDLATWSNEVGVVVPIPTFPAK